jgi:hypothetical protein
MNKLDVYKSCCIWRLLILFSYIALFSFRLSAQRNFDYTIYISPEFKGEILESVNDMAYWLEKSTDHHFEVKTSTSILDKGIQLQALELSNLSQSVRKKISADGQSFYLSIDGTNKALIAGTASNSFINGIYTFLQELGFRWYMPGDTWTIVPDLKNIKISINKVFTPDFQNRTYFGTGGIAGIAGIDPQNNFKKDFEIWNRRNRFGGDYATIGHTGEAFYSAKKQELDQHPEYFCNNTINKAGRIDISQQGAVDIFVSWALSQKKPNSIFPVIGVDPADGSGGKDDCLPTNMPQVQTWSDKYFFLANKVAERLPDEDNKTRVQLYAYASHTAPPNFDVNKKVYPVIIPYAFQNVADPEQYIELWQKKMRGQPMGIYDYWNITQWSTDVPQFNIYSIPEKLRFWKLHNITTINLESTNAKGPMGLSLWIAAQMMWNVDLSFEKLYQEFLNDCFGPAANDVKKMYDRWSLHYQGPMEAILSLHDLDLASAKTKDEAVQKRIAELKAYVHYLKLYYDYQSKASISKYEELINYVYSIHSLRLLQTSPLLTRYINKPAGLTQEQKGKPTTINYDEIEVNFEKDLKENPNAYQVSDFVFNIAKATPAKIIEKEIYNPSSIIGKNNYQFYLPANKNVIFQLGSTDNTQFTIKDENGKVWLDKTITGSKQGYQAINLDLPMGKYTLSFGAYYRISRIIFPHDIAFFSSNNFYDNAGYPLIYIYVPKDVNEIIYRDQRGPGVNNRGDWRNPDGQIVKAVSLKYDAYRIEVAPSYRGKVWVLNIGHRNFELLNIPNIFSLNNFSYKE